MMGNILVKSAVVDFSIQYSLFLVAALLQTEKFYDLAGSGTFALLAYLSLKWGGTQFFRQRTQSMMVITSSVRLALYLFSRVMKEGGDRRFNAIRGSPGKFFVAWTLQGMWVFLTLLPTLILNSKKKDEPMTSRDYLGWAMWASGFLCETVADYQKSKFRAIPDNAGKFIHSGLWSISRHPNYFGNILQWTGLFISASSVMKGWDYLSVISPVFITFLLTQVSGIPLLERHGMKRWGENPHYLEYIRNTAVLVPFIW